MTFQAQIGSWIGDEEGKSILTLNLKYFISMEHLDKLKLSFIHRKSER